MRHVRALYWNNVDLKMVRLQARVCEALGLDLVQEERTGLEHGAWLGRTLDALGDDDTVLILDIDCIPLDRAIVERAFRAAEGGALFGVAHVAVHIDRYALYPGPMFLALSKRTWLTLGRPSLSSTPQHDVGQRLMTEAQAHGVAVELVYPSFVGLPKWQLGHWGCIGIATVYEGAVFHLFRSRRDQYGFAFDHVAQCVLDGRPIDFLWLHARLTSPLTIGSQVAFYLLRRGRARLGRLASGRMLRRG